MAVADFGGSVLGRPIEVMQADDQNKCYALHAALMITRRQRYMRQQNCDKSEQPAAALCKQKSNTSKSKTPSAQGAQNRIRAADCKRQTERQHQIEISGKTVIVLKK